MVFIILELFTIVSWKSHYYTLECLFLEDSSIWSESFEKDNLADRHLTKANDNQNLIRESELIMNVCGFDVC